MVELVNYHVMMKVAIYYIMIVVDLIFKRNFIVYKAFSFKFEANNSFMGAL